MTTTRRTISLVALNVVAFLAASSGAPLPFEIQLSRAIGEGPGSGVARASGDWLTDSTAPMIFVAAVAFIWWRFGRSGALTACVAGLATVLVRFVDLAPRPRPTAGWQWTEPVPDWGGYPSGHVVFIAVTVGVLVHAARLSAGTRRRPEAARTGTNGSELAVVCVTSLLAGWTRVAAGAHWAFDVVGGALVAALIVQVSADWVVPWIRQEWPRVDHQRPRSAVR